MLVPLVNIVAGTALAAPLLEKVSWLKDPVHRFAHATAPYRPWIGVGAMAVGAGVILCEFGVAYIPAFYGADLLDGVLAFAVGGLLAESWVMQWIPRNPLCDPLHRYETYIGAGSLAVGTFGIIDRLIY